MRPPELANPSLTTPKQELSFPYPTRRRQSHTHLPPHRATGCMIAATLAQRVITLHPHASSESHARFRLLPPPLEPRRLLRRHFYSTLHHIACRRVCVLPQRLLRRARALPFLLLRAFLLLVLVLC
jgi:hypothetical protein